jgi:response regulator RpfG family c-di-GMP phosphodiesterase
LAAMLCDVVMVVISDAILKKPARLDDNKLCAMQQHTVMGETFFSAIFRMRRSSSDRGA